MSDDTIPIEADAERIRKAKDGDLIPVSKEFVEAGCPMPLEIKPGPELDRAVAEAIGLESACLHNGRILITPREWDEIRGIEHPTCEGDVACISFQPSTDLNAAFAAVPPGLHRRLEWNSETETAGAIRCWAMLNWWNGEVRAEAPTPALAICAVILKWKETEE